MAWGAGVLVGAANTKTSGTSLSTGALTAGSAVGDVLFAFITIDNAATTTGATTTLTSVTDTKSNTWTKVAEETCSSGAAGDGVTVGIFSTQVTSALVAASDSITVNLGASVAAKAITVHQFTVAAGHSYQSSGTPQQSFMKPGTAFPTLTVSGLTNAEHLWVCLDGWQVSGLTFTKDTNFTLADTRATTGGSAATNIQMASSYRIFTGTTTSNSSSISSSENGACILAAFTEIAGGTNHPVTLTANTVTLTPAKNLAGRRLVPLISTTLTMQGLSRKMTLLRPLGVALTTTQAAAKAYGRILTLATSLTTLENQQTQKPMPQGVTTSVTRVVQAGAVRSFTAALTATKGGIKVFPHALTATVVTVSSLPKQVNLLRPIVASIAVTPGKLVSVARPLVTATVAAAVGAVKSGSSVILQTLATTVNPVLSLPKLVGASRSTTVSAQFTQGPLTDPNLTTSPNLLTGLYAPDPAWLLGRVLTITAALAVGRPFVVRRVYPLTLAAKSVFTKVTTGVPRIVGAVISTLEQEASTMTRSEVEEAPETSGEGEATTMGGDEE